MSLRNVIKAIIKANQLGAFAEPVTFTSSATYESRTVWMGIHPDRQRIEADVTDDELEVVECFCLTDPTDVDKGGVSQVRMNDQIVRSATYDPDDRPFFATGEVRDRTETTHILVFRRDRRLVQAARQ